MVRLGGRTVRRLEGEWDCDLRRLAKPVFAHFDQAPVVSTEWKHARWSPTGVPIGSVIIAYRNSPLALMVGIDGDDRMGKAYCQIGCACGGRVRANVGPDRTCASCNREYGVWKGEMLAVHWRCIHTGVVSGREEERAEVLRFAEPFFSHFQDPLEATLSSHHLVEGLDLLGALNYNWLR